MTHRAQSAPELATERCRGACTLLVCWVMTGCIQAHEVAHEEHESTVDSLESDATRSGAAGTQASKPSRDDTSDRDEGSASDEPAQGMDDMDEGAAGAAAAPSMMGKRGNSASSMTNPTDAMDATDPNAVVPGTICDRLAQIQCEAEQHCCDNPGRDLDACHASLEEGCETDLMTDSIAADPIAAFDATHAKAAFDEFERLASECDPSIVTFGESVAGLRGIFAGTLQAGASCRPFDLRDRAMAGASLAACSDPAHVACLPRVVNWTCEPRADIGSACFSDVNCLQGLFCDNPDLSIAGSTCMPRKPAGSDCVLANECESFGCSEGVCAEPGTQAAYCLL